MFVLADFIRESNHIDPQYNANGALILGDFSGQIMFENHLKAFNTAVESRLDLGWVLRIHRELTRGIDVLEGNSGSYRQTQVWVGGRPGASQYLLRPLIEERLIPWISRMTSFSGLHDNEKERIAWTAHDYFQHVHPFIDGNGRTGRCIMNALRIRMGLEGLVIWEADKEKYYNHIRNFRYRMDMLG